jgi:hypothetical protein
MLSSCRSLVHGVLSHFSGVCSSLSPVSSSFSLVSTQCFLEGFLSRSNFINKLMDACYAWNCVPGENFLRHFQVEPQSRTILTETHC